MILSCTSLFYSLREARAYCAAAFHPDHGFVITGGRNRTSTAFSSSEATRNGAAFQEFPALPIPLVYHSIVALDGGEEGDFLVIGGHTDIAQPGGHTTGGISGRTFLFKKNAWTEVASMPSKRYDMICGPVSGSDERVEKVVCVGGRNWHTVEVYDLSTNSWSTGKFYQSSYGHIAKNTNFMQHWN